MYTILFIEDDIMLLDTYAELCKILGYNYLLSHNGKEALAILDFIHVDLIFSDGKMPEVDGYEVLHHIKTNPSKSRIPFILFTGSDRGRSAQAFQDNVMPDALLIKPGNTAELCATIVRLLPAD